MPVNEEIITFTEISLMKFHKIIFLEEDGMFYRETTRYAEGTSDESEVFGPFEDPMAAAYGIHFL